MLPTPGLYLMKSYLSEKIWKNYSLSLSSDCEQILQGPLGKLRSASSVPPGPGIEPGTEEPLGNDG